MAKKKRELIATPIKQETQEKKIVFTTDGQNVKIFVSNVSALEFEMMMLKGLDYIKGLK